MPVEPRFRDQIRCLVLKDRRTKALNDALSPEDRIAFNGFLVSVTAVLVGPRLANPSDIDDIARFSKQVATAHRRERRPVNEFVIEEILREIYGFPPLFRTFQPPPAALSNAGAAIVRHLTNTDARVAATIDHILDTAEDFHERRVRR